MNLSHPFVSLLLVVAVVVSQHCVDAFFGKKKEAPPVVAVCQSAAAPSSFSNDFLVPMIVVTMAFTGTCAYVVYTTLSAIFHAQLNDLKVQLAGKTNSAFVFIKPHACKGKPGYVEAVVEGGLTKAGIRITDKGEISAEEIDAKMLIDGHYGAIASKAVKLQPSELNVPDKGKLGFQEMFGESWEDAIAGGKVYNAKDAAAKLQVDGEELEAKWRTLENGKNLIKFGGGFYCGKLDNIYIINAFYMSMRAAYCNPGEKIKWYTVSWPSDALSWADFRGKVLGATDPAAAANGSIRKTILEEYFTLGLQTKPDTGNNGVHASASPLEGLAERMNWLGVSPEEDGFGKALLAKGIHPDTIREWTADAQVTVQGETEEGKTMSIFDALEDLDADTVLAKVDLIGKL